MMPADAIPAGAGATLPAPPLPRLSGIALFLDVDGTLVAFAPRPHDVRVEAGLPALLQRLRVALGGALAPISGRPLQEIDQLLQLPRGAAAGLHGAQLRRADGVVVAASRESPRMRVLRRRAGELVAGLPGVLVEDKPDALALHYRNAPAAAAAVSRAADTLAREAGADYTLQPGNHVIELKPAGTDKGSAVATLMGEAPFEGRTPWVLGDDLTDEHAFAVAHDLGGNGIIVGPRRPTAARHALADPAAAHAWLAALAAQEPALPRRSATR
jgi:trehalose 6-phosphate phosphatase